MNSYYDIFHLRDIGWIGVVATDIGLTRSVLPMENFDAVLKSLQPQVLKAEYAPGFFSGLAYRLESYFAGKSFDLDDKIDLRGAPLFFKAAWEKCRTIPLGETRSYSWLAEQLRNVKAVRAVGQAMARNPLPIIVPCHRVIGKNGSLTGFAGTIPLKQKILDIEQQISSGRQNAYLIQGT